MMTVSLNQPAYIARSISSESESCGDLEMIAETESERQHHPMVFIISSHDEAGN